MDEFAIDASSHMLSERPMAHSARQSDYKTPKKNAARIHRECSIALKQ